LSEVRPNKLACALSFRTQVVVHRLEALLQHTHFEAQQLT
jgi:hypothetical protein